MMQIIYCKNCNASSFPVGNTTVTVEMNIDKFCIHCQSSNGIKKSFFFCCQTCFYDYMEKVLKDKMHTDEWWL